MTRADPQPPPLRGVLFDFAGTLFDDTGILTPAGVIDHAARRGVALTEAQAAEAIERTLAHTGLPEHDHLKVGADLSPEAHRRVWGGLIAEAGPWEPPLAAALYEALTDVDAWQPYPDARATVAALAARDVPVGLLSNIGWDVRPTLARTGILEHLTAVVLSWEAGMEKPEPELFALACERLGLPPEQVLFVGDDPAKDGAAARAGLTVLLLPSDRHRSRPRGLARALDLVAA